MAWLDWLMDENSMPRRIEQKSRETSKLLPQYLLFEIWSPQDLLFKSPQKGVVNGSNFIVAYASQRRKLRWVTRSIDLSLSKRFLSKPIAYQPRSRKDEEVGVRWTTRFLKNIRLRRWLVILHGKRTSFIDYLIVPHSYDVCNPCSTGHRFWELFSFAICRLRNFFCHFLFKLMELWRKESVYIWRKIPSNHLGGWWLVTFFVIKPS